MRGRGILGAIVVVWLLIGVFAAWQRDYFKGWAHQLRLSGFHRNDRDRGATELQNQSASELRYPVTTAAAAQAVNFHP